MEEKKEMEWRTHLLDLGREAAVTEGVGLAKEAGSRGPITANPFHVVEGSDISQSHSSAETVQLEPDPQRVVAKV